MKIEIALTSSESKRLIAKAVLNMETVNNALKNGILAICKGSTNAFIIEELTGSTVEKGNYTAGYVGLKGLSVNPKIPTETIFVEGKVKKGAALADIMNELKSGDVIIKGANAIGPDGIPAVLIGRGNPKSRFLSLCSLAPKKSLQIRLIGLQVCLAVSYQFSAPL
jgi:methionine synthase I (cobalamin-dependent)